MPCSPASWEPGLPRRRPSRFASRWLEPGTHYPYNRRIERKLGRVPKLEPGASYRAAIDFGIHVGTDAVKHVVDQIAVLQGQHKPTLDNKPVKVE